MLKHYLGIDFGTSGCRACIIDATKTIQTVQSVAIAQPDNPYPGHYQQDPNLWWQAFEGLMAKLAPDLKSVHTLAINGTSATTLLCDFAYQPLFPALMYNDSRAIKMADSIKLDSPQNSPANSPTSSLAKALYLQQNTHQAYRLMHQADWFCNKLLAGNTYFSDENNALKLGYDVLNRQWPEWLNNIKLNSQLPSVRIPGTLLGNMDKYWQTRFQFNAEVKIAAGTTDSIAAFIASGAHEIDEAVTSIGSTLVLKIITEKPIYATDYGIYSHRLDDKWLAGGASNSGGNILKHFFSQQEIEQLSLKIDPSKKTMFDYYPLIAPGERFPINDPLFTGCLQPRPKNRVIFLQALLEGIAKIEQQGYHKLAEYGANPPKRIITMGGGSKNRIWQTLREQQLQLPITVAEHSEAAYGSALLAFKASYARKC